MRALRELLESFRTTAQTHREAGTYFEELIVQYLRTEPVYRDLYAEVLTWTDYAKREGKDARDTGIALVALTHGGDVHAVQCKLYAPDYKRQRPR